MPSYEKDYSGHNQRITVDGRNYRVAANGAVYSMVRRRCGPMGSIEKMVERRIQRGGDTWLKVIEAYEKAIGRNDS
jgi:hypothetical protein